MIALPLAEASQVRIYSLIKTPSTYLTASLGARQAIGFRGGQVPPLIPPTPLLSLKIRERRGAEIGNLGVWVGFTDPNTQISDFFPPSLPDF